MGNSCKKCMGQEPELGDKIADKWDDMTHPGETKGEKFVRKVKEGAEDLKDDIVDGAKELKDKVVN